jgi:hypothetical protein
MTTSPSARPIFDPVDTSAAASFDARADAARDDVESPSLTNGNALARFEFESGRTSKDGTKVLMVEWEETDATRDIRVGWELSWEGNKTVLPARDQAALRTGEELPLNRLYFLLGPGVPIPTAVKLQKGPIAWRTNPLPAIFAPELGATARQAGKKGVLHTIWAKKRLQVLQDEIEQESKENVEGIGLEMAVAEKEWIEQNFGVAARPGGLSISTTTQSSVPGGLNTPVSPRSPGGGRLMDRLKGLKLGTSAHDLASGPRPGTNAAPQANPLSPESSDVAVGGFVGTFAALKGTPPPPPSTERTQSQPQPQAPRKIVAQLPPDSLAAQQRQQAGMGSINAFAAGDVGGLAPSADADDDLFAVPLSPRSPEMSKSPFSFAAQDTTKYLTG